MVGVVPFLALRYRDLARLVALTAPHAAIDAVLSRRLHARSPYNVVRLELGWGGRTEERSWLARGRAAGPTGGEIQDRDGGGRDLTANRPLERDDSRRYGAAVRAYARWQRSSSAVRGRSHGRAIVSCAGFLPISRLRTGGFDLVPVTATAAGPVGAVIAALGDPPPLGNPDRVRYRPSGN